MIIDFRNEHQNNQFNVILNCKFKVNSMYDKLCFDIIEAIKMLKSEQKQSSNVQSFANDSCDFFVDKNIFDDFKIC